MVWIVPILCATVILYGRTIPGRVGVSDVGLVLGITLLLLVGQILVHRWLGTWFLFHYLKHVWVELASAESNQDVETKTSEQRDFQTALQDNPRLQQMLLLVNQLEQDLGKMNRTNFAGFGILMVMPLIQLAVMDVTVNKHWDYRLFIYVGVLMTSYVTQHLVNKSWARRYEVKVTEQLDSSQLVLVFFTKEVNDRDLEKYVPWLFRRWINFPPMPKGYADDLRKSLWRISHNLDWYLAPPRKLVRASWILAIVIACLSIGAVLFFFFNTISTVISQGKPRSFFDSSPWMIYLSVAVVSTVLSGIASRDWIRSSVDSAALVKHLRSNLAN